MIYWKLCEIIAAKIKLGQDYYKFQTSSHNICTAFFFRCFHLFLFSLRLNSTTIDSSSRLVIYRLEFVGSYRTATLVFRIVHQALIITTYFQLVFTYNTVWNVIFYIANNQHYHMSPTWMDSIVVTIAGMDYYY